MFRHVTAWFVVFLAVLGIGGGLGLYKYYQITAAIAASASFPEPMEAVATARADQGQWSSHTRAIGTIVALRQLEVRNEIAGAISELGFSSGDVVEAGQLLIQLDTRQEKALLAAAEAEAKLAKLSLERRESLRSSPAFSAQEFDRAEAEFAAATARARNLEVSIEKKRITAPFKARIGITNLQPGTYLDAGTRIVTLQGLDDDAYVDFSLPQDAAAIIRPGATVDIESTAITMGYAKARIAAEAEAVDAANRSVRYRAVVSGLGQVLRPGMFVDVVAATSKPQTSVLVPVSAVRRSSQGEHVFVIVDEDGKMRARQRPVQTRGIHNERVAIRDGLAAGELIATSGSFKLRDGLLVQTDVPPEAGNQPGVN